jgi:predicted phosphoribosyltransferase
MSSVPGSSVVFKDRVEAGQRLAALLRSYREADAIIYALPRGGVVVGAEVARALGAPLEVVIARKVGHPQSPEYAICAVSVSGSLVCNEAERSAADPRWFERAVERERQDAARRQALYLGERAPLSAEGKTAVVVDDGIATGLTMRAAIEEMKSQRPRQVVVAVPVIPRETAAVLRRQADAVVAVEIPQVFLGAVGAYYVDFDQVSDEEVIRLLRRG